MLLGVTRKYILQICKRIGVEVRCKKIKLSDLDRQSGAFLSGTSIDILPIRRIDHVIYERNSLLSELIVQYESTVRDYLNNYEVK